MIIGSCPYDGCEDLVWLSLSDDRRLPLIERHRCDGCGREIWTRHSRVDPQSWTAAGFKAEWDVDEGTHVLRQKRSA